MVERAIGRPLTGDEQRAVESITDFETELTLISLMHAARCQGYTEGAQRMSDEHLREQARRYDAMFRIATAATS